MMASFLAGCQERWGDDDSGYGGSGYIGSHTAKMFRLSGYRPLLLDDLSTGNPWAVSTPNFVEADLADEQSTYRLMVQYKVAAIIHFAASAYVAESVRKPEGYFKNVSSGLKLLNAARRAGVDAIVFSSSCATYGIPDELPFTEDHRQVPISPYGDSKLFLEKALLWYGATYGCRSVSLRYLNAVGADPEGALGECHNRDSYPAKHHRGHAGPPPGRRCLRGRLLHSRRNCDPRLHPRDRSCQGHLLALEYLLSGKKSCAINLGTGQGTSILGLIGAVEKTAGRSAPIRYCDRCAGDSMSLMANNAKAPTVLGWRPTHSGVDEIVRSPWRWTQKSQFERTGKFSISHLPPALLNVAASPTATGVHMTPRVRARVQRSPSMHAAALERR